MLAGCFGFWLEFLRELTCFWLSPPVMTRGTAFSPSYRFTLSDGTVLSAHTKCKLCYPSSPEMQPFIMGIHVIDRYVPTLPLPSHASARVGNPGIKGPIPYCGRGSTGGLWCWFGDVIPMRELKTSLMAALLLWIILVLQRGGPESSGGDL